MVVVKALIGSIFVFCFLVIVHLVLYLPIRRKKLLKEAIDKGHVIQAHYLKACSGPSMDLNDTQWLISMAIYEYEHNGKKYQYKVRGKLHDQEIIELYYINNPKHADTYDRIGVRETPWILFFLIPFVIILLFVM